MQAVQVHVLAFYCLKYFIKYVSMVFLYLFVITTEVKKKKQGSEDLCVAGATMISSAPCC